MRTSRVAAVVAGTATLVASGAQALWAPAPEDAAAKVNPQSLSFGKQKVGTKSAPKQVVVSGSTCPDNPGPPISPGNCPEPLDIAVSGDFVIVGHNCPPVLPGGLSPTQCTINVAFKPKSKGKHKGFLRIQSTPFGGVPLDGKGCKKKVGGKLKQCKKK